MSLTVRELMKKSGVTLKDVALESSLSIPIVCNILNDELVDRVKKNAIDIIVAREKAVMHQTNQYLYEKTT
jgi:hypothetical protein